METTLLPTRRKCPLWRNQSSETRKQRRMGRTQARRWKARRQPQHGLPEASDPLQWLLALVAHEAAPIRLRMAAAKAALPYCHAMP